MIDINAIIVGAVGLVTTIISSVVSWLLAKKKYNSEVDHNLIENMRDSLEFYKQLSDDNKSRLDESLKRCGVLEQEMVTLRKQMLDLTLNICMDLTCRRRQKDLYIKPDKTC